jgi:hypothetical protein
VAVVVGGDVEKRRAVEVEGTWLPCLREQVRQADHPPACPPDLRSTPISVPMRASTDRSECPLESRLLPPLLKARRISPLAPLLRRTPTSVSSPLPTRRSRLARRPLLPLLLLRPERPAAHPLLPTNNLVNNRGRPTMRRQVGRRRPWQMRRCCSVRIPTRGVRRNATPPRAATSLLPASARSGSLRRLQPCGSLSGRGQRQQRRRLLAACSFLERRRSLPRQRTAGRGPPRRSHQPAVLAWSAGAGFRSTLATASSGRTRCGGLVRQPGSVRRASSSGKRTRCGRLVVVLPLFTEEAFSTHTTRLHP